MKSIPSPQYQAWNKVIIRILKKLGSLKVEYPPELYAAKRAAFIHEVEQHDKSWRVDDLIPNEQLLQALKKLKTARAEYPPELLAARRAAFVDGIQRYQDAESVEELHSENWEIIQLLKDLKSVEVEYPPTLLTARRSAFKRQIVLGQTSVLEVLRTSIQNLFSYKPKWLSLPATNIVRTSLAIIMLTLAVFVGFLLREPVRSSSSSRNGISQPGGNFTATSTHEFARVVCKPGYLPPLCLVNGFDKDDDLTFQGNGVARPAVAKDAFPDRSGIHKAAYVNDGLYGPRTSWISNSAYSWIKIDLGKATTINTVAFGKDRLGSFHGGDPGQFVIAVALSDNVYADGNSSNDYVEYTKVYDSQQTGFNGVVSGAETILAQFRPITARYIKITFANPKTTVDEVDAFMIRAPVLANQPTKKPKENLPGIFPTTIPTNALAPTATARPAPTNTPVPANTATPVPTDTLAPTDTPLPASTNTPLPAPTDTPLPVSTDASPPAATDTSIPSQANMIQSTSTSMPLAPASVQSVDVTTDTPAPPAPADIQSTDAPTDTSNPAQP